jgi:sulfur transfer protein SufE
MSIENKVNKYKEILNILPTPQEKYEYLVDQAKKSSDFPEELRLDEFKVPGCQSQVCARREKWLP